ncbi:acyl-CoA/acyl-ACP dehydrogenase [Nocardia sp. NBC_01499]|uniref:acyl-CoA dehydrogenase n=1 Tax=Nocardia sp. NBC_01499 TaxID=2903597 RepID=UPI003864EFF8
MRFMSRERETAERYVPGLDNKLGEVALEVLESPESPGLSLFRAAGGAGLLIAKEAGGLGASLLEAAQIHRVLGSRSPSLAIAVNMHSCTVAAIPPGPTTEALLGMVAQGGLYLASAFAEGVPGASVIAPKLRGERVPGGWKLSGSKKPCSLARSMDILTASVMLRPDGEDEEQLALVIIPADSPGIEVRPLGNGLVFPGSETEEVVLTDVEIPEESVSFFGKTDSLNAALTAGWLTFELLVSACYLGMASGLAERVLDQRRGSAVDRMLLVSELDAAMAGIESVATDIMNGRADAETVARALHVRFAVQRTVERTSALATELLGGVGFMVGSSALYYTACRGLAFHPPSRVSIAEPLDRFIAGESLIVT